MAGRFVIDRRKDGRFYWVLRAGGNNRTVLVSEGYAAKGGARNGVEAVQSTAPQDCRFDRRSNGKYFYFVLKTRNGEVVGRSHMYRTERARERGILAVRHGAPSARVIDLT
jgi:uncharacterized protein YegP (UPF0339 family)